MSFVLNLNDKCLEAVNVFITLTVGDAPKAGSHPLFQSASSLSLHLRAASAGVINRRMRRSSCNIFRLIMQEAKCL